ncbi:MAG TPA: rhodanese-like domain-containing protein [Steroidobacteraceae bacterium]|nr:rhodanese-like domain-containing protein [Steroidobacteraceae bacterium]
MQELTQHLLLHPYLAALAAVLLVAVIVTELRNRGQGSGGVSPTQTIQLMNKGALVIDVRANDAYAAGHIGDARNIVAAELAAQAEALKRYREKPVVVCCDTGVISGGAARRLATLGFTQVANLRGGLNAWRQENLPLIKGAR